MAIDWPTIEPRDLAQRRGRRQSRQPIAVMLAAGIHALVIALVMDREPDELAPITTRLDAIQVDIVVANEIPSAETSEALSDATAAPKLPPLQDMAPAKAARVLPSDESLRANLAEPTGLEAMAGAPQTATVAEATGALPTASAIQPRTPEALRLEEARNRDVAGQADAVPAAVATDRREARRAEDVVDLAPAAQDAIDLAVMGPANPVEHSSPAQGALAEPLPARIASPAPPPSAAAAVSSNVLAAGNADLIEAAALPAGDQAPAVRPSPAEDAPAPKIEVASLNRLPGSTLSPASEPSAVGSLGRSGTASIPAETTSRLATTQFSEAPRQRATAPAAAPTAVAAAALRSSSPAVLPNLPDATGGALGNAAPGEASPTRASAALPPSAAPVVAASSVLAARSGDSLPSAAEAIPGARVTAKPSARTAPTSLQPSGRVLNKPPPAQVARQQPLGAARPGVPAPAAAPEALARLDPEAARATPSRDRPTTPDNTTRARPEDYDINEELAEVLTNFPCARVAASDVAADGKVTLSGFATSEEMRADLLAATGALDGIDDIDGAEFLIVGAPCAMVRFAGWIDGFSARTSLTAPNSGLPPRTVVHPGEPVPFALTSPEFPSYILLDYYRSNGDVYHLDHKNWPRGPLPARTSSIFGGDGLRGVPLTATLPYGREMMAAVASSEPLLEQPRQLRDDAAAYVLRLANAIEGALARGTRVEVFFAIVDTAPPEEALAAGGSPAGAPTQ
ncbi:MAG: hypothetical protein AAGB11_15015 [Pseudomonadota bacterium]